MGKGGVMRLYAASIAVIAAVTLIGISGGKAFADSPTTTGVSPAKQQNITVQMGDNLSTIAASNNTTYIRIYDANSQITNPDLIYPGEVLTIPSPNETLPQRLLPSADEQTVVSPVAATTTDQDTDSVVQQQPVVSQTSDNTPTTNPTTASNNSVWNNLAQCESSGNWSINTGNGFYGGLQFTLSSWDAVGGTGYPNQASQSEQILLAQKLQAIQGWGAWPACSAKLGL